MFQCTHPELAALIQILLALHAVLVWEPMEYLVEAAAEVTALLALLV
jgi:predicted ferric reductase